MISPNPIGGLKVAAQVMGIAVHEPSKTVAVAVSRLDGDVWDGCVELWKLSSLDATGSFAPCTTSDLGGGCKGRVALPYGVSSIAWLVGGGPGSSGGERARLQQHLEYLVVGCDDGVVAVLSWDPRKPQATSLHASHFFTEHDDMVNCVAAPTVPSLSPTSSSSRYEQHATVFASGSADGSVRVWDLSSSIPQSSVASLPCPQFGNVTSLAIAPWAERCDALVVCYGNSSSRFGPCLGLWVRNPKAKVGVAPTVLHGLCATPVTLSSSYSCSSLGTERIGECASPMAVCYTTGTTNGAQAAAAADPPEATLEGAHLAAAPGGYTEHWGHDNGTGSHSFVVAYDDGTLATYDDRSAFESSWNKAVNSSSSSSSSGSKSAPSSSSSFSIVTPLRIIRPHGASAIRCIAPLCLAAAENAQQQQPPPAAAPGRQQHLVLSGSEDCRALLTPLDTGGGAAEDEDERGRLAVAVVDTREDYLLAVATVQVAVSSSLAAEESTEVLPSQGAPNTPEPRSSSKVGVLTGGVDGQVRLAELVFLE